MRLIQYVVVFLILLPFSDVVVAQQLKENEIVVIGGEKYILHQVRTGETVYSITQKFNIDNSTLIENNPEIADGLNIGKILKIPYRENANLNEIPVYQKGDPDHFEYHTIHSRTETPYFIAKKYGITVEEIYAYNPEITKFKKGTKLRIPRWNKPTAGKVAQEIQPEQPQIQNDKKEKTETNEKKDELVTHEVQPGETLFSISRKYGIAESEILFLNPGARKLTVGSTIYLPAEKVTEVQRDEPTAKAEPPGNYFEHIIESGETLWAISRKFNVSEEELKNINPVLRTAFPAGVVIKIPVQEESAVEAKPVNEDAFIKHTVRKGETLYSLASKYNLNIPEIEEYNPVLRTRNLIAGETLLIPKKPDKEIADFMQNKEVDSLMVPPDYFKVEVPMVIPENCEPGQNQWAKNDYYDVALFIPLFLEANDTLNKKPREPEFNTDSLLLAGVVSENDTLVEKDEPEDMFFGFYRNTQNYLQFYEGVLLAVDSMQNAGMHVRLHVFDTQQNRDSVQKFIYADDFLETDLIIGPVFQEVQGDVADIAAKNNIPMISPLSAESIETVDNSHYYQVNPNREYLAVETANLVAGEYFNSNFIVFKTNDYEGTPEGRVVNLIQEKLYNSGFMGKANGADFRIYDFEHEGPFGLRRILSHDKENVIYIPSSVVGELSVAVSNINNLADEYSITLIGSNRFQQYESIELEQFHNLKLKFVAPYWVDYNDPATVAFFKKFKDNFYTEPNNFGMQGYDVAFYFLNALFNYGRDFNNCLPYLQADLIQGNYQFEKISPFGGYMNIGVSVVSYQRNFDVVRERVIGQYKFAQK